MGQDVTLEVLHPPRDRLPAGVERNANNGSLVLRLDYGDVSFLLTGDIEVEAERYLAAVAGRRSSGRRAQGGASREQDVNDTGFPGTRESAKRGDIGGTGEPVRPPAS